MILSLLQGWVGAHSALEPAGPQAGRIHALWQFMWVVSALVFLAVVGALLYAALHRRAAGQSAVNPDGVRSATRWVSIATGVSIAILIAFLGVNFVTARPLTSAPGDALQISVTGYQWWWSVQYPSATPSDQVTTANEIHVPVGRPVVMTLSSRDVIHSFWPANLVGKRDLIPGNKSSIWFQADTPGVYRGQCAEFCGHQHAKMGFLVVADPPAQFEAWLREQRDSAPPPPPGSATRGQEVFLAASCVMCHTIRGTPAGSRVGPDLTHLASRRTLAAATLENTRANLAAWISDPQRIKPGTLMPPADLTPADLAALLDYLETLR